MITDLSSPSVCVIDDEEEDYIPILNALITLGLGSVHIRGRNDDPLPPQPFNAVRLVFVDLHLNGLTGKSAASHTANVVRRVIPAKSGPILVVIWSKYAHDPVTGPETPPDDQQSEADIFKSTLLGADPSYKGRLVFTEMPKPKPNDGRPTSGEWALSLQAEISRVLEAYSAFNVLWRAEGLVRDSALNVTERLAALAGDDGEETLPIEQKLRLLLRLLTQQQAGPDISQVTAERHFMTVFSQLGQDIIEATVAACRTEAPTAWLADAVDPTQQTPITSARLNSFLLTAPPHPATATFMPGTVFNVVDIEQMEQAAGFSFEALQTDCFNGKPTSTEFADFKAKTKPVFVEITPACDFHQGHRRCATLIAGLVCEGAAAKKANSRDACRITPLFEDRYVQPAVDVRMVFCSRFRFTTSVQAHPRWLEPRLRLRDVVATDIRNWHSSQASRVGYLSFR